MALASRVLRHLWVSSVLCLAACTGSAYKAAAPSTMASSPPSGGGYVASADYQPAPPAHAEVMPAPSPEPYPVPDRPGLGTSWGEQVSAPISFQQFARSSAAPWAELLVHYNDADGVDAHAQYLGSVPRPLELWAGDGALSVALVDEAGHTLPGFTANGRTLVLGHDGERYRIVVNNRLGARFEIVASVDGLDVIDGKPADPNRRGYIVDPYGTLVIDGFRTSDAAVAAFRFGRVAESYAAQTSGDRNVGVVGFAIFGERGDDRYYDRRPAPWTPEEAARRDSANPFPDRGYATPPR